jgi:hypothetical protein
MVQQVVEIALGGACQILDPRPVELAAFEDDSCQFCDRTIHHNPTIE